MSVTESDWVTGPETPDDQGALQAPHTSRNSPPPQGWSKEACLPILVQLMREWNRDQGDTYGPFDILTAPPVAAVAADLHPGRRNLVIRGVP